MAKQRQLHLLLGAALLLALAQISYSSTCEFWSCAANSGRSCLDSIASSSQMALNSGSDGNVICPLNGSFCFMAILDSAGVCQVKQCASCTGNSCNNCVVFPAPQVITKCGDTSCYALNYSTGYNPDPGMYVNATPTEPGQPGSPGNGTPCSVPGSPGGTAGSSGGSSGSGSGSGGADLPTSNPSTPTCNYTGDNGSVSSGPINNGNGGGDSGNSGSPIGGGQDQWGNTNNSDAIPISAAVDSGSGNGISATGSSGNGQETSNNNLAAASAGMTLPAGVAVTALIAVLTLY